MSGQVLSCTGDLRAAWASTRSSRFESLESFGTVYFSRGSISVGEASPKKGAKGHYWGT